MVTPVENMASSLALKYAEIVVGGSESKLNKLIKFCENIENREKLSSSCCRAFEREERFHHFAQDFVLDKAMLVKIVKMQLADVWH